MAERSLWRRALGTLLLLLTTFIWGTAFLAQKVGGEVMGPFAMTFFRNLLGGGFLLLVCCLRRKNTLRSDTDLTRPSIRAGIFCGIPLFAAMASQQEGINYTSPGISAFLTANYVIFVPIIVSALRRRLPSLPIIIASSAALIGTYFICMQSEGIAAIGRGEAWTILCALLFAVHMIIMGNFAPRCDVLVLSTAQLFTSALLSVPFLLLPSEISCLGAMPSAVCILSLLYLGIFSSGIAETLQGVAQARTPASIVAVMLSMESVFGALSGWVALDDVLSPRQLFGCALVFVAAIGSQLIDTKRQS